MSSPLIDKNADQPREAAQETQLAKITLMSRELCNRDRFLIDLRLRLQDSTFAFANLISRSLSA